MSTQSSRPASLLLRSITGIAMLLVGTTAVAWLMHAGIETDGDRAEAGITTGSIVRGPLGRVRSWSLGVAHAGRDADLIAVDPSALMSGPPAELPRAIEALKQKSDGRARLVLARVTIASTSGDQLDWTLGRHDSRHEPSWLDFGRTDKAGRWAVSYSAPEWQNLLIGSSGAMVDRLAAAGFDGIYIADGDAYLRVRQTDPAAESEMTALITRVAARGKAINPDFAVVLANAEELIAHPSVRDAVDGFAKENLFFSADEPGSDNARSSVVAALHFLGRAQRAGYLVLISEHVNDTRAAATARNLIAQHGFIGTIDPVTESSRPLD